MSVHTFDAAAFEASVAAALGVDTSAVTVVSVEAASTARRKALQASVPAVVVTYAVATLQPDPALVDAMDALPPSGFGVGVTYAALRQRASQARAASPAAPALATSALDGLSVFAVAIAGSAALAVAVAAVMGAVIRNRMRRGHKRRA